jgi:hypothetical protein
MYAAEIGSDSMIHMPNFMKSSLGVQAIFRLASGN